MSVSASVERLELVRSALAGLGDGNPVALATARSILRSRELGLEEARVQLRAEAVALDEAITAKGRGGKPVSVPGAKPLEEPPPEAAPGMPGGAFDTLHPRGTGGIFVRKGDSGSHVSAMQTRLQELGHPAGRDGTFGRTDLKGVKSFQKQHGLPQTGVVDQVTLEAMRLPPNTTRTQSSAQLRAALKAAGQTSKPGDVGENVSTLQTALAALGHQVTDPAATYGPSTEMAVRAVQQQAGLAPTGRMDEQTAAVLATATPGQENHGNVAGDDLAAWGLKPQGKRAPGRMTSTPERRTNPRRNPAPRRGAPGKGGGTSVKEGEYEGRSSADSRVAAIAQMLGLPKPPNLREAPNDSFAACASCVFFSGSSCSKYNEYPVERDDLCDDWKTLTPVKDRPSKTLDEGDYATLFDPEDDVEEAKLSSERRKSLPTSAFAVPEDRAYPIHDEAHARNALARSSGKEEESRVRAAVKKRYPKIDVEEAILERREVARRAIEETWSDAARKAALLARRAGSHTFSAREPDQRHAPSAAGERGIRPEVHTEMQRAIDDHNAAGTVHPAKVFGKKGAYDQEHNLDTRRTHQQALAKVRRDAAEGKPLHHAIDQHFSHDPKLAKRLKKVAGVHHVQEDDAGAEREAHALGRKHAEMGKGKNPPSGPKHVVDAYHRGHSAGQHSHYPARESVLVEGDLDRSPKANWVENAGGLPSYIERIAKHVHADGKDISSAIAIAVATVKRWCAGGSASARGGASPSHVTAKTKAQACAAVAEWEAKKASTKAKKVAEGATLEEALTVEHALWLEENPEILPPSLRYCERVLEAVQARYDDWDDPPPGGDAWIVFAQESAWKAAPAAFDPELDPFMRVIEGTPILFVAGVPVRKFETLAEATGTTAAATTYSVGVRRKNAKRTRTRAAERLAKKFDPVETSHNDLDLEVHAVVSKRFAGRGAIPRSLARDSGGSMQEGDSSPDSRAGSGEGIRKGGAAGRVLELAEAIFNPVEHPRDRIGKFRESLHALGFKQTFKSPIGYAGDHVFEGHGLLVKHDPKAERVTVHTHPDHFDHEVLVDLPDTDSPEKLTAQLQDIIPHSIDSMATGVGKPTTTKSDDDALVVDKAIGSVLQTYPGLTDWKVEKGGSGWHVKVTMADGEHHIHVSDDGAVSPADEHGVPKPKAVTPAPAPPAAPAMGYQLTGAHEKPYHMDDGQVFQGAKGGYFKKLASGKMTSAKGWTGAGVHVHDLQTDTKKWIPSFAMKDHLPLAVEPGQALPEAPAQKSSGDLFGDLMSSVGSGGSSSGDGELSFHGKNVVVTGKIPGYTRDEVHAMLAAKGATAHSSVAVGTHYLIAGENVGATKTSAAVKKGVEVLDWHKIKHLVEADLTPRVRRLFGFRADLEEAASDGVARAVTAKIAVIESRLDDADRDALAVVYPSGLARYGVRRMGEARLHRPS